MVAMVICLCASFFSSFFLIWIEALSPPLAGAGCDLNGSCSVLEAVQSLFP